MTTREMLQRQAKGLCAEQDTKSMKNATLEGSSQRFQRVQRKGAQESEPPGGHAWRDSEETRLGFEEARITAHGWQSVGQGRRQHGEEGQYQREGQWSEQQEQERAKVHQVEGQVSLSEKERKRQTTSIIQERIVAME